MKNHILYPNEFSTIVLGYLDTKDLRSIYLDMRSIYLDIEDLSSIYLDTAVKGNSRIKRSSRLEISS